MNFSWQLLMLPHGLIALSISTVIFPRMARLFEQGDTGEVRSTFTRSLSPLLFLTLPASIGLYEFSLAIPIALFERGEFDRFDSLLVASALEFLALGLVFYGVVEIATRIFYAMKDTVTPVVAGLMIIVLNMALGYLLLDSLGHVGLAIGLTASTGVEALILMVVLRRRVGGLDRDFGSWLARLLLAAAAMALVAELVTRRLHRVLADPDIGQVMTMMIVGYAISLVAVTFFVAAWLLRIPEATGTLSKLHAISGRIPGLGSNSR
jgi:putative peptidoglycan lipid II flippase